MLVKMRRLIKGLLACMLLLSFVSVLHAADDAELTLRDGVIYDSNRGLEWAPAPTRAMNHYQAEEYVRNLSLTGGGWRLPTRVELKSLYDPSNPGGADPRFTVSDTWVWTSELDDPSSAWGSFFITGVEGRRARDYSLGNARVLAVRAQEHKHSQNGEILITNDTDSQVSFYITTEKYSRMAPWTWGPGKSLHPTRQEHLPDNSITQIRLRASGDDEIEVADWGKAYIRDIAEFKDGIWNLSIRNARRELRHR